VACFHGVEEDPEHQTTANAASKCRPHHLFVAAVLACWLDDAMLLDLHSMKCQKVVVAPLMLLMTSTLFAAAFVWCRRRGLPRP
jgi:hypothetical protein